MARRNSGAFAAVEDTTDNSSIFDNAPPAIVSDATDVASTTAESSASASEPTIPTVEFAVRNINYNSQNSDGTTRYILFGHCKELQKSITVFVTSEVQIEVGDILSVTGNPEQVPDRRSPERMNTKIEALVMSHKIDNSPAGVETWLAKNIPNIGKVSAKRIVAQLGGARAMQRFEDLNSMIELGVKKDIAEEIYKRYRDNKDKIQTYIYLAGLRDSTGKQILNKSQIKKIQESGNSVTIVENIKSNPWSLIRLSGIGFKTADELGISLGFSWECPERVHAGCAQALTKIGEDLGHTAINEEAMVNAACSSELLNIRPEIVRAMIDEMVADEAIIRDDATGLLYHPEIWEAENTIVDRIVEILSQPPFMTFDEAKEVAEKTAKLEGITTMDDIQMKAVIYGLMYPGLAVIGGPGTGKSTIQRVMFRGIASMAEKRLRNVKYDRGEEGDDALNIISPSCPTGKAAVRLSQASGFTASTTHSQLMYKPGVGFRRNKTNPIPAAVVATDEFSMMDTLLSSAQFSAIAPGASFLLVGDDDQLTSVGPGQVLRDIIDSGAVPTVVLENTYRQAKGSGIPIASERIRNGYYPFEQNEKLRGIEHINVDDSFTVSEVLRLVTDELVQQGLSPDTDVIVMSPMRKGKSGVELTNKEIKSAINPRTEDDTTMDFGTIELTLHDLIMNLENTPNLGIMNGDIGNVTGFTKEEELDEDGVATGKMFDVPVLDFDGRTVVIPHNNIKNLTLNNTSTVHKQQGSENTIAIVIIPQEAQHMNSKNLLFTGLTRARGKSYIVGSAHALMQCINNVSATNRSTGLRKKLTDKIPEIRRNLERVGAPTDYLDDNQIMIERRRIFAEEVNARAALGVRAPDWAIKETRKKGPAIQNRRPPVAINRTVTPVTANARPGAPAVRGGVRRPIIPGLRNLVTPVTPATSPAAPAAPAPPALSVPVSPAVRRPQPIVRATVSAPRPVATTPSAPRPEPAPSAAPSNTGQDITPVQRPASATRPPVIRRVVPPLRPKGPSSSP